MEKWGINLEKMIEGGSGLVRGRRSGLEPLEESRQVVGPGVFSVGEVRVNDFVFCGVLEVVSRGE
jgi:hypothetical protein